jgi:hypothetical protein
MRQAALKQIVHKKHNLVKKLRELKESLIRCKKEHKIGKKNDNSITDPGFILQ